jgi:cytochrome c553
MRLTLPVLLAGAALNADEFARDIRPVLVEHCSACHGAENPKNRHNFLKSSDAGDVETRRSLWRSVAMQLRNRTMPPGEARLEEGDRLRVANWIEQRLRATGCQGGEYAGNVGPRRLNRREYRNTLRDLLGVDMAVAELLPADEAGGAGFDTNAETLYVPPMLVERYLEVAQKIVDRVIVTPPLNRVYLSHEMAPRVAAPVAGQKPARRLAPGEEVSTEVTVYSDGAYGLRVSVERPRVTPFTVEVKVDGIVAGKLSYARDANGGATARVQTVTLSRGAHTVAVVNGAEPVEFYSLTVTAQPPPPTADQAVLHYRLLGVEPGQTPVNPEATVRRMLQRLVERAFRRPADATEVERYYRLYERAARRGDPFEEAVKYALKAVLVSPRFLFRVEEVDGQGMQPLDHYAVAARLSYFLWATMPDEELFRLAREQRLDDAGVLAAQVDRMLDDPRSRAFASSFIGQWLGTQEIGGRAMPLLTELQHFYTPEVAADLREQPELFFHYMLTANRPVLDILDAPYTFLTERLVRYYELEGKVEGVGANGFYRVFWPDNRRAGVLGLASVLGMNSHYKQASPILRGAWILDTLLGTPIPPPPPNVPALEAGNMAGKSMREMLVLHRSSAACAACHNLMDPMGLGLENFDWMGRWLDREANGEPVDASGVLPSGERFNGPVELRAVLVERKREFVRQLARKMLGYAIGRGEQDGDQCTIERLAQRLEENQYAIRTLVKEVVLSTPFRYVDRSAAVAEAPAPAKRAPRRLLGNK